MLAPIIEGIILGVILSFLIGPAFFALLQTSIEKSFKAGCFMAVGVFLSDLLYVVVAYLGATQIFQNPNNHQLLGITGGCLLIGFGLFSLLKKHEINVPVEIRIKKFTYPAMMLKGFLLNIANPFVAFFWLGVMTLASSEYGFQGTHIFLFFASVLGTVLLTDTLKAYIAHKIKRWLRPNLIVMIKRVAGSGLIVFGITLIVRVLGK